MMPLIEDYLDCVVLIDDGDFLWRGIMQDYDDDFIEISGQVIVEATRHSTYSCMTLLQKPTENLLVSRCHIKRMKKAEDISDD